MCGIAGVYHQPATGNVERMVARLGHRGPDGSGIQAGTTGTLGHTRLAIVDIDGGHQPLSDGRGWISFNGEIYNHKELRSRYLQGRRLHTHTDTEVVLHLYDMFGPRCVKLLDGMFAFAILHDDQLFLARDPLGIKPLYLSRNGNTLSFASEVKALATITDDIRALPPGSWYHSISGETQYYTLPETSDSTQSPEQTEQVHSSIRETLRSAVLKRLMADVPVGVSLSGGLDSSIVALLAREGLERLETFAVGVEGSEDLAAAREVARFLGTHHHEYVYTEREMLDVLPDVILALESFDPALVRSAIPNYFLARLAAGSVKVMLTGEGADELYAGYDYLRTFKTPEALHNELAKITAALHNTNLQRADRMSMVHGLEARVPFLDVQSVELAFSIPGAWKLQTPQRMPKAVLRNSFASDLPPQIVARPKQKYSSGAGSSQLLADRAETRVSDSDFALTRKYLAQEWSYHLPNKEAYFYYDILRRHYRDEWILPTMGRSRSL